jgi:hypothetical protein
MLSGRRRLDATSLLLAGVLLGALALRLWGIRAGLPFSYNEDEERHFVPIAVSFLGHGLNPGYFLNPPGYTELLAGVYALWFHGGAATAERAFARDPSELLLIGRVTAALLGTLAVALLHASGARLFDRRVGLLAAALGACAFLPVSYAHLALNDVPALALATLALLATALVLRGGGTGAALFGGLAVGLAAGTKYTAGIMLLPLMTAIVLRGGSRRSDVGARAIVLRRAALALLAAVAGFLVANPYALLDPGAFRDGLAQQEQLTGAEELTKLGLTQDNGVLYYLWTFTWGLGWVPAFAALGGAVRLLVRDRRLALVLLPAPLLFVAYMGSHERYFGRWLLPVFPIAIVLAASFALACVRWITARAPRLAAPAAVLVPLALLAQGLVTSIHTARALARPDTRGLLRAWLVAHVPAGERIVVEPIAPERWGARWQLWNVTRANVDDDGRVLPNHATRFVKTDRYERTLRPALLDMYVKRGYCWVVIGSTQYARAFAQPALAARAIAYYRELARRGRELLRVRPYEETATPPSFNFDWSFNAYPLVDTRAGPEVVVYELPGCHRVSSS